MVCLLYVMQKVIRRNEQAPCRIAKGADMRQVDMSLLMSQGWGLGVGSLDLLANDLESGTLVLPRFGRQQGIRERRP
jgi:hypothetical protein